MDLTMQIVTKSFIMSEFKVKYKIKKAFNVFYIHYIGNYYQITPIKDSQTLALCVRWPYDGSSYSKIEVDLGNIRSNIANKSYTTVKWEELPKEAQEFFSKMH